MALVYSDPAERRDDVRMLLQRIAHDAQICVDAANGDRFVDDLTSLELVMPLIQCAQTLSAATMIAPSAKRKAFKTERTN